MMNAALRGLRTNAQHRMDQATGAWTRSGKGRHENFAGWALTKSQDGWTVTRPDGTVVACSAARTAFPTLAFAKAAAATAGA